MRKIRGARSGKLLHKVEISNEMIEGGSGSPRTKTFKRRT